MLQTIYEPVVKVLNKPHQKPLTTMVRGFWWERYLPQGNLFIKICFLSKNIAGKGERRAVRKKSFIFNTNWN